MRYSAAPIDLTVKIVSSIDLVLTAGLWVGSCFIHRALLLPAAFLALITLYCYLRAPVAYEASPNGLTVVFRLGSRQFGPIRRVGQVEKSTDRSIRLWGNGGLFETLSHEVSSTAKPYFDPTASWFGCLPHLSLPRQFLCRRRNSSMTSQG